MLQQIGAKLEDFFDDSTIPRFGSITVNNSPDGSLAFKITKLPSLILFDKYFSVHFWIWSKYTQVYQQTGMLFQNISTWFMIHAKKA